MNKKIKKIFILITVLFVIMFLLSTSLIFGQVQNNLLTNYRGFQEGLSKRANYNYNGSLTAKELAAEYTDSYSFSYFESYAWGVALYNKDNEIVEMSGSHIGIYDEINDSKEIIFIDKYLTSENKLKIYNFQKSLKNKNALDILEFNYIEKDNTKIPVSFVLFNVNNEFKTIKIDISNEKNYKTIKNEQVFSGKMWINFVDINEKSYLHKTYNYIYNLLSTADVSDLFQNHSGGGYGGSEEQLGQYYINLADGEYVIIVSSVYNPNIETLQSDSFIHSTINQSVYFIIFYLIAIISLTIYFKKRKKLEDVKNAFTSAAAHELKTPLSVIENQCECIMENVAPEKNTEYINSIYSETLRMNKLISSLLQYNRLASADHIKMEKCRLDEILNMEIEKYQTYFSTKNIRLETDICDNLEIKCNAELIALVIDNYLSNAVKHTDSGNTIKIFLKKCDNGYRFSVYNEGKNIPNEYKDMLFNILYKTDKARNRDDNSTGMGLAICKEILEQHKFKYGYSNKRNGVEFYFTT